jgi:hypothetical protein
MHDFDLAPSNVDKGGGGGGEDEGGGEEEGAHIQAKTMMSDGVMLLMLHVFIYDFSSFLLSLIFTLSFCAMRVTL